MSDEEGDDIEASSDEYDDATEIDDDVEAVDEAVDIEEYAFDVVVNGKTEQRTLSELKQSYAGQSYIQQKMRENAETAKQLQQERAEMTQERATLIEMRQRMMNGEFNPPTPPSEEIFSNDPVGYMEAKMHYDKAKEAYDARQAEFQQQQQLQKQQEVQQNNAYLRQQMELLQQRIPEFADPQTADKMRKELVQGGQEYYGVPAEVLGGLKEAVEVEILRDAIRYRKMQEGKATAQAKVKKGKPMVRPGAKKVQDGNKAKRQKQMGKLRQTNNINDAIDLMYRK